MRRIWWCVAGLVLVVSCSKRNPEYCDEDEPCPDPAKPFCDLDGLVDGSPNSCIAVDCAPGTFAACDGEQAIQCNNDGNNYDVVACERGCDDQSAGCRLCDPGETACTNGITATCDPSGAVISMTPCPLGCFESEPRCRTVDPSNGLAQYLDSAETAADVDLPGGTLIDTMAGTITPPGGSPLPVASFLVPAPTDGVPIRVFVVGSLRMGDVRFVDPPSAMTPPAVALVSARDVTLEGVFDLNGARVPPGAFVSGPCTGADGAMVTEINNREYVVGSGGGGHATPGGLGGEIQDLAIPPGSGAAGQPFPNPELEPLRGGCAGGFAFGDGEGAGGGAVQIVSGTRIRVGVGAVVDANGQPASRGQYEIGGGGSGGGILLEAPTISLDVGAKLLANGGGGMAGDSQAASQPSMSATQEADAACVTPGPNCSAGGAGGTANAAPRSGGMLQYTNLSGVRQNSGGGGGSVGFIRINTQTGTYAAASDAVLSPMASAAELRTR